MSRIDSPTFVQLLAALMNNPEVVETLSRLGISLFDNNRQCFLTEGMWKEISDEKILKMKDSWASSPHPENREETGATQGTASQSSGNPPEDGCCSHDEDESRGGNSTRSEILFKNEDGSPWITICVRADSPPQIEAESNPVEQRMREVGVLASTIEVIISSLDLNDTVQRILEQAKLLVPYDQATVQVLHDGFLETLGGMGFADSESHKGRKYPFPEEGSLRTRAIQERRPWLSNDVARDSPEYVQLEAEGDTIRSWLGVPLVSHGDVIGLLTFCSKKRHSFEVRHCKLAQAFASPVAIALENARMHGETYELAMKDALTGIGSRHAFNLNSKYFFEKAKRESRDLAFAMLDLDWFKKVNDDFGHLVGDRVLQAVCQVCTQKLRTTDFIARYGGEEIIILFPDTSSKTAANIVERICRDVSRLSIKGVNRPVTVSAGISGSTPTRKSDLNGFIKEADDALYQSKENGRNRITVFQK